METPGVPNDNTLMRSVLDEFATMGFDGDFAVQDGPTMLCRSCDATVSPDDLDVADIRRLEGASDPADMAAIVATTCPSCGTKGTLVATYGPMAEPAAAEFLSALEN